MKKTLTKLEIWKKVKTHLLKQNRRSEQGEACLYRGPDGLKCAVGCLIKDSFYRKDLEGRSVRDEEVRRALRASGVPVNANTIQLLYALQAVHDGGRPESWRVRLNNIKPLK